MKMLDSLKTCKDKVGYVLEEYPVVRDSDKLLWLAYLCKFHGLQETLGTIGYQKLKKLIMNDSTPTMESIRRIRQKYQENGQFVGENRAERIAESEKVKEYINETM